MQKYKIIKNGCILVDTGKKADYWKWLGHINPKGYGRCTRRTHLGERLAHRYIYRKFRLKGKKLPKDFQIDHLCNHKDCVNPFTIEAVTNKENSSRKWKRNPRIHAWKRKLTSLQVRCIRFLNKLGMNYHELSRQFKADPKAISQICKLQTYKDVQ